MQRIVEQFINKITAVSLLFFLFVFSVESYGQSGSIDGYVRDKSTNEPLPGSSVSIEGSSTGVMTNIDGHFTITNLKPGTYKVKVTFVAFKPFISEEILITAGNTSSLNVFLASSSVNLNAVNVSASRKTGTDVSVNKIVRNSTGLANGVSSQLIAKLQDRDAADVVKRIPGITIMDDKFIIVRGLSQRYNTVWLNNAATPSSETDTKAFSFDVIPSSMIDNIIVYKTTEADFPSDYSGGFVKITTKAIPDQNSVVLSYSASLNQGTTFQDFYKYPGSKTDWLGYDNGFRDLPKEMPANLQDYNNAQNPALQEKVSEIGKSMNKSWVPELQKANADQRFSLGISRKVDMGNSSLGNITALTYSNTNDYTDFEKNNNYSTYLFNIDQSAPLDVFRDQQYTNSVKIGILHNWALYLNQNNRIEFRNLFNQIGYSRTTMREGHEGYNDRYIKSKELSFLSRSIYSGQLGGLHNINDGAAKIDWTMGYSITNKKEPDMKRYSYVRSNTDSTLYFLPISGAGDLASESRRWLNLDENLFSGAINFTKQLNVLNSTQEIKGGIYYEKKDREFAARNFGYATTGSTYSNSSLTPDLIFTDANFNLTDGIKLIENTDKADSYSASSDLQAAYLMVKIPIAKLNLNLGVRAEKGKQVLHSYQNGTSTKVDPVRDTLNFFPSVNVIYNLTDRSLLRLAYGKTVNRPEFREMAPFTFVDFNLNALVKGFPDIKQAYVNSYDLRYEFYPAPDETFTIGGFYKQFTNAIEFTIFSNSPTQYTYQNVKTAYNYGVEVELKKNLEFIGLKNFDVLFNGSLIKSKISAGTGDLSRNRPLQGQSPYIVNAGVFYQSDVNGLMVNVIYNIIGKRIVAVGRPSPDQWEDIPDIYESPRSLIDLTISKKIGRFFEIKGGIKDLINQKAEFTQTVKTSVDMSLYGGSGIKDFDRKQVTKLYNPGRIFSLGLTIKL